MKRLVLLFSFILFSQATSATLLNDPNDPRTWQGATVGTFAQLFYGADTLANRQLVISNQLLDDSYFNTTGFFDAPLIQCNGCTTASTQSGKSLDTTGTGSLAYSISSEKDRTYGGSHVDQYWIQTGNQIGGAVWDLGPGASTAIIFNTIDHGPLPQEAIESTVYLSNDLNNWIQAVTQRVWLEGFEPTLGILWDGFTYAVGTGNNSTFRYASIIWGGPGALIADGDNEINGVMGATGVFTPPPRGESIPSPSTLVLFGLGFVGITLSARKKRTA